MQASRRRLFRSWSVVFGPYRGAPRVLISLAVASTACSSSDRGVSPSSGSASIAPGPQFGLARQALGTATLFDGPVTGTAIVPAERDTTLIAALPNANFGSSSVLRVQGSIRSRALVGMDPQAIAQPLQGNHLLAARLILPIAEVSEDWGTEQLIGVHRLRHGWAESAATWNCAVDSDVGDPAVNCSGNDAWAMFGSIQQVPWLDPPTTTALVSSGDGGALVLDVTRDVACSMAGEAQLDGWLIKKAIENNSGPLDLTSRDGTEGPALLLSWTDDSGVAAGEVDCTSESSAGGTCTASAPVDVTCDGVDDDCDGAIDEDFVSVVSNCGAGVCAATGVTSCNAGVLSDTCQPAANAGDDTSCDGVDQDCDGTSDEDYVPLATSCGIGACGASGTTSCSGGVVSDSCQPGAPALDDSLCNGLDDNCNGSVDENYASVATSCGIGACNAAGATSCVLGEVLDSCSPGAPALADASCDGVDDDCDGVADENYAPLSTSCGIGACGASGSTSCNGGSVSDSCQPGVPALDDSACNGVDDDCNGTVDEDYAPLTTSCGIGACGASGSTSCVLGDVVDSCHAGTPAADDASCDGVDDDCNGAVDEDYAPLTTSCGIGACGASGSTSCNGGSVSDSCQPGTPAANDASCNGVDDDCSGQTDEDYAPLSTSCGVGACSSAGATSCVLGAVVDSCQPGTPAATDATCDGVDDDCDGITDEDYVPVCSGSSVLHCVAGALQGSDCSDGNACNGAESCSNAQCFPGTPPEPDDSNPCTADSCVASVGVVHTPIEVGTACDDFFECDGATHCVSLLPPDPAEVAPQVAAGFVSLLDRMRFLFEQGSPPIQTGVAPGTLQTRSAGVVRGRVLTAAGQPLRGVSVQVHDHPEFGQTLSRLDGRYDLVVNGGGPLTLELGRDGFLPAQRTLRVPAQDYAFVSDVVLLHPDTAATEMLFPSPISQQHESSVSSDADGSRHVVLHVNSGTSAQRRLANGTLVPVEELTIRTTEFTVGSTGRNAMPAGVPASSGYTYALEFGADTQLAAGERIEFAQPVTLLVDNFLHFPTGRTVPVGAYDRTTASWLGEPNGRVIQVLGVQSGLASLDLDGSGQAASSTALDALGISAEELQMIAQHYATGSSLWRAALHELAPYDLNDPFSVLRGTGGVDPDLPRAETLLDQPALAKAGTGAGVELENQVLAQQLPIAGTPFTLNYRTDRVPGNAQLRSIDIPVTGASVSNTLAGEVVEVLVAGQRHEFQLPALPNQVLSFTWDGLDGEQRPVQGRQPVLVNIGAILPARFTRPSTSAIAFGKTGNSVEALPARQPGQLTVYQSYQLQVGMPDSFDQGLGAWSISAQHSYDPNGRILYRGDGPRRSANSISDSIERLAGVAHTTTISDAGDGGPALSATLNEPRAVAVGPDGALYIGARLGIRRVDPNTQTISTVAGGKSLQQCDPNLIDGSPANMCLFVRKLDLGPDGALYISDNPTAGGTADRIRRLDLKTGQIRHIAGQVPSAGCANRGDGGLARNAAICNLISHATAADGSIYVLDRGTGSGDGGVRKISPNGMIDTVFAGSWSANDDSGDIAVGPDGSLYVTGDRSIRRIFPTGEERVFAGTGVTGFTGDGAAATSATFGNLGPFSVQALPDGRVLVGDNGNLVLRLVDQKGIITRFAGAGIGVNGVTGDGGAPLPAGLGSSNLRPTLAPDGSIYFVSRSNQTIRRIRPTLSGNFSGEQLVASENGREVYRFDANGRHLQTLHALTHGVLYSFGYDSQGRLQQITDGDGNATVIAHGPDGAPLHITAPFGQQTVLETDANGYLSSVTDPSGAQTVLSNDALGRLIGKVDARGGQREYQYDTAGRLISTGDSVGELELTRTGKAPLVTVTRHSAEGLQASYTTESLAIDVERRTKLREDGRTERLDTRRDQLQTLTRFDATLITSTPGPDPVWGMGQPLLAAFSERLPSGSTRAASEARSAVLNTPSQPLTLRSSVQTFTLNGRVSTLSYDDPTHALTARSPRNRQRVALLDARGRITQLSATGLLPAVYGYNAAGRFSSFVQGTRSYAYSYDADGFASAIENGLGQVETLTRDANGRVIARERTDGSVLGFAYDAAGNLIELTPPGRPTHDLSYTARDLLESSSVPGANGGIDLTSYVYDGDDRLTQIFRPDGSSLHAAYDTAGRLGSVTLPTGTIALGYAASTGHLQTLNGPAGVNLTFQRDGEFVTSTQWSGAVVGTVAHSYDTSRRLSSESINGANSISFGYDEDGLVTSAGSLVLNYDANLPLLTTTTLGQVNDTRGYNTFGELTSYSARFAATELFAQSLVRDTLGRVQQLTDTNSGVATTTVYGYDDLGQLSSVTIDGALARTYGYDTNGNRTSLATGSTLVNASYDAQDRLLSYGALEYAYAADGTLQSQTNLVTGDVTGYAYDALGNLLSVELPDGRQIDYLVDGMGRRVGKKVNGVLVQQWLYRSGPNPVAELNGSGALVKRFVYASRNDVPDFVVQGGATYRVLVDQLGSVRRVVNVANASDVLVNATYDEFGNASGTGLGACPFGFAAGMLDADTLLVHSRGRDYSPAAGRWLSTDPLRMPSEQANPYAYLGNAPLSLLERTSAPAAATEAMLTPAVFEETRSLASSLALPRARGADAALLPGLPRGAR